jgi:hypothetical protein
MDFYHPDFLLLFDWLAKMSKELIKKQGAFLPHGAIVSPEGKLAGVGASTKEAQPGAQQVLQLLEGGIRGMAAQGKCRGAGIALDTRLKAAPQKEYIGKDAIWVFLEERGGQAQSVYVPYAKSWTGEFTYSDPFAQPDKPRFFGKGN